MKLAVINGPNLKALGQREQNIYGNKTLKDLEESCLFYGKSKGIDLLFYQSNIEGEIIDFLYEEDKKVDGFIINPGALTHYSYALRDCIAALNNQVIEVHISNVEAREEFRKTSVISSVANGKILGFGFKSYLLAIEFFFIGDEK